MSWVMCRCCPTFQDINPSGLQFQEITIGRLLSLIPGHQVLLCGPFVQGGSSKGAPSKGAPSKGAPDLGDQGLFQKTKAIKLGTNNKDLEDYNQARAQKPHTSSPMVESVQEQCTQQNTWDVKDTVVMSGTITNAEIKTGIADTAGRTETGKELVRSCGTYNCHGFKQSMDYVLELLANTQILCLCETWLKPSELNLIDSLIECNPKLQGRNYKVFSKSIMHDIGPDYTGRPYGGVAIICELSDNFTYHELTTDCERIITIGVCDISGSVVQIITSVYMPYFKKG